MATDPPSTPGGAPWLRRLFDLAAEAYARAVDQTAVAVTHDFTIAGQSLRLHLAGEKLLPLTTSALLQHAAAPGHKAATVGRDAATNGRGFMNGLSIQAWDAASTGVPMPPLPWQESDDFTSAANSPGAFVAHAGNLRMAYEAGSRILSLLDTANQEAIFCVADVEQLPYYECAAPLQSLLQWWLGERGLQFVHAAAVGRENGAVLLAGKGGSGKSTLALACLERGLDFLGDDYVLVRPDQRARVFNLYGSGKLDAGSLRILPNLMPQVKNHGDLPEQKGIVFVSEFLRERIAASRVLRAVVLPRVTGETQSRIKPTSQAAALRGLAPSTLVQLRGAGHAEFSRIAGVVRSLPCHELEVGTDIDRATDLIESLLAAA